MVHLKHLCAIPFLTAAGFAAQAAEHRKIAVYGNVDLGVVRETGSPTRVDRGYNNWLGFKGREDLGSGLSAIFHLQTRFNPDTGRPERKTIFWQGESTVGLSSATSGTVRLGRALSPLWHNVWAFEPWHNSGFNGSLSAYQTGRYSSDAINDVALGFANFSRISNGLFYATPDLSGLQIHVASELEKAVNADGRTMGASLNYANGPLAAMFSYERNARKDDIYFLGASYRFDAATVMASYSRNRLVNADSERNLVLAGTYAIGADAIRAGYGRNDENGNHKSSLGYIHSLSQRTKLYADVYREKATGSKNGLAVGMSHTF